MLRSRPGAALVGDALSSVDMPFVLAPALVA